MWELLGRALGVAWAGFAISILVGCLGAHWLAFALYAGSAFRERSFLLPIELIYGLGNPVAYLLILQPALFGRVTPSWLVLLEVTLLSAYWVWRLLAHHVPRIVAGALLVSCMVLILALAGRDLRTSLSTTELNDPLTLLFAAPLYAVPLLAAAIAFVRPDEPVSGFPARSTVRCQSKATRSGESLARSSARCGRLNALRRRPSWSDSCSSREATSSWPPWCST